MITPALLQAIFRYYTLFCKEVTPALLFFFKKIRFHKNQPLLRSPKKGYIQIIPAIVDRARGSFGISIQISEIQKNLSLIQGYYKGIKNTSLAFFDLKSDF
jgi:hypothetical protein